jgi:hypothetical protein
MGRGPERAKPYSLQLPDGLRAFGVRENNQQVLVDDAFYKGSIIHAKR